MLPSINRKSRDEERNTKRKKTKRKSWFICMHAGHLIEWTACFDRCSCLRHNSQFSSFLILIKNRRKKKCLQLTFYSLCTFFLCFPRKKGKNIRDVTWKYPMYPQIMRFVDFVESRTTNVQFSEIFFPSYFCSLSSLHFLFFISRSTECMNFPSACPAMLTLHICMHNGNGNFREQKKVPTYLPLHWNMQGYLTFFPGKEVFFLDGCGSGRYWTRKNQLFSLVFYITRENVKWGKGPL